MDENFLIHYGVPGMKWGVRRELGKKARAGYRISEYINKTNNKISRLDNKISKYKNANKNISSLMKKRGNLEKVSQVYTRAMNKAYSGLSQRDIDQGRRAVKARRIGGIALATLGLAGVVPGAIGGPVSGTIGGAILSTIATSNSRSLRKYSQ